MAKWRKQLARRPGEGSLRRGWRLSRAGWRLLRGDRTVAALALAAAALTAALTVAEILYVYDHGGDFRRGDLWGIALLQQGIYLVVSIFVFAAMAIAVDTRVDESPADLRDALSEAWERRGPLLAWGFLAVGFLFLLGVAALAGAPWWTVQIASLAWTVGTVFVIPALVLDEEMIGGALTASLRTVTRCGAQTFAGLVRIVLWTMPALIPASVFFVRAADEVDRELQRGAGLTSYLIGAALWALVGGLAAAASQAFALLLYRDAEDDLPAIEAEPADPMRLRRRIAVSTAGVFGLLLLLMVIGGLAHDPDARCDRGGSEGRYCFVYDESVERYVEDGMPVRFQGREVGYVAEHELVGPRVEIVLWIQPRFRRLLSVTEPCVHHPQGVRPVIRLEPTGELS